MGLRNVGQEVKEMSDEQRKTSYQDELPNTIKKSYNAMEHQRYIAEATQSRIDQKQVLAVQSYENYIDTYGQETGIWLSKQMAQIDYLNSYDRSLDRAAVNVFDATGNVDVSILSAQYSTVSEDNTVKQYKSIYDDINAQYNTIHNVDVASDWTQYSNLRQDIDAERNNLWNLVDAVTPDGVSFTVTGDYADLMSSMAKLLSEFDLMEKREDVDGHQQARQRLWEKALFYQYKYKVLVDSDQQTNEYLDAFDQWSENVYELSESLKEEMGALNSVDAAAYSRKCS